LPNDVANSAMTLVCTHCSRTNSADARYCYHDGASLLGSASPALAAHQTFLLPFVFESGMVCQDFNEFALGCESHWDAAVEMLAEGSFQQFFKGMGRMDLAQLAKEAANFPDRDRGLDQFLGRLPTSNLAPAKLDVQPKLINLGTLKIGQNSQLELCLENQGSRLIFGSIGANCSWLTATDSGEAKLFQFRDSATITIQVKGQHLRAGVKPMEGNLLVESNAGTFSLKVIATVPIQAFPDGCLAGARSPREIAEKAKAHPNEAGTLFASGAVARWYQTNGWTYPVQGPASNGMAAVQQFFEALGVSRAPKVFISEPRIHLKGMPGATLTHQILVRSAEQRPVFAHAVSTADWCVVKPGVTQGNFVAIPVEIAVPEQGGTTTQTLIRVTSNGQQRFEIPVQVTADQVSTAVAAATTVAPATVKPAANPATASKPAKIAETAKSKTKSEVKRDRANQKSAANMQSTAASFDPVKLLMHAMPLVLLGFALLGLIVKDAFSDAPIPQQVAVNDGPMEELQEHHAKEVDFKVAIQDEPDDGPIVAPKARYEEKDEPEERFGRQPVAPVKVDIKDEKAENNGPGHVVPIAATPVVTYSATSPPNTFGISGAGKQLTFSTTGRTNTTVVSVNGGKAELGSFQGRWTRVNKPVEIVPATSGAVSGSQSTWLWGKVAFHQVLEIVPGQPIVTNNVSRRQLDTVLVRWIIQNTDSKTHNAGLRMELDTLIGSNDGVPFTVPGYSGLVNTYADFKQAKDVPDFIQALERADLKSPGTIAHLTLKPGIGIEPASRVSLTHWSGASFAWNIPISHLGGDSSVVLYWPEKAIKAGEKRTIGFAYGLGNVTSNDKLGLTFGGQFEPGQNFTASAYVENPIAGQTLRLELPDGLRRVEGAETQTVVVGNAGGRNTSIVTWKILVERTGEFKLKVLSSTGLTQARTISIERGNAPTGGKLSLDLQGSFEPGQVFSVLGKVNEPVENQKLTLHLPAGLQKVAGEETLPVPAPQGNSKDAVVEWKVRVVQPGKYPVRVSSSTGVAQTKTITIVQPTRAEGAFQILLTGDFAPGKAFTVSTKVVSPIPDQKLTLLLPAGLERLEGNDSQIAKADVPLTWKVKIKEAGKFTVGVKSTTGVTQRKTITIEPPGDQPGRFDFAFTGAIRPGREFKINAQISDPTAGQTLTLVLPKGLQLADGDATQLVPKATNPTLTWNVRVTESGRLPVRIESSTGLAHTKTIQLSETSSTLFGR
jgi:hypothetical protein